jgi:DNA adenine methylase
MISPTCLTGCQTDMTQHTIKDILSIDKHGGPSILMLSRNDKTGVWGGNFRPLIKWTGGKSGELEAIDRAMSGWKPTDDSRYIEPFIGGGAVGMCIPSHIPAVMNDTSKDLIELYASMTNLDGPMVHMVSSINHAWQSIDELDFEEVPDENTLKQFDTMLIEAGLGEGDGEAHRYIMRKQGFIQKKFDSQETINDARSIFITALKGAFYERCRAVYNTTVSGYAHSATYWFIRDFCYGGMFRANRSGKSNVPYGGKSYNKRNMSGRLAQISHPYIQARLKNSEFHALDFEEFLAKISPSHNDFVFLDPPYDSKFSTYDGQSFSKEDHHRLGKVLSNLQTKWLLVIAETDFVNEVYGSIPNVKKFTFPKNYKFNVKGRVKSSSSSVTYLLLSNYSWE